MSRKLTIGFITTSFPRYKGDAAGNFVFGLAAGLSARGHKIQVVVPEPADQSDWKIGSSWLEGVEVTSAAYAIPRSMERLFWGDGAPDNIKANPLLACLAPSASASLFIKATVSARNWDAVVSHWLVPSALAAGAAKIMGVRHLALAHSADVNLLRRLPFGSRLGAAIAKNADHLGFVSAGLRDEFLSLLSGESAQEAKKRSSVLLMGVNSDSLATARSREEIRAELGAKGFCVLFLGRLVHIKGVDLLIDAMRGIDDSTLILAGDGSMRASLQERAKNSGVDARFLGFVGPEKRAELLLACDAIALPSRVLASGRHEGLPVSLVEAMQAGLPAVVSATGSMPELVKDNISGLVVESENASALGSALKRICKNPKLARRLARNARQRVSNRDWSSLMDSWENLLLGLVDGSARTRGDGRP